MLPLPEALNRRSSKAGRRIASHDHDAARRCSTRAAMTSDFWNAGFDCQWRTVTHAAMQAVHVVPALKEPEDPRAALLVGREAFAYQPRCVQCAEDSRIALSQVSPAMEVYRAPWPAGRITPSCGRRDKTLSRARSISSVYQWFDRVPPSRRRV